ncbi:Spore wall protein 2-like, partial [Homarus americanus]
MEIEMLDWILEHAMKHGYDDLFFNMMTSLKSETMCEFEEIQCVLIAIFLLNNLKVVDDGEERMKIVLVDWEAVKENLTYQDDNFKDYYTKNVRDIHAAIDASSQEDVDRHMDRLLREQLRNLMVALKTPTVSSYLEKINGGEVVVEIAIQNTPEYNMLLHAFEEQLSEASLSKLTQRLLNMRKSRVEKQAGNLKEPQTSKNTGTGAKENISRNKELCVSKGSPSDSCVSFTDKDPPVNVEAADKDPPVNVETSPDKDTPVDVEASPDKDPPVDVEASPDKDPPVNVEASPDKDTPVDVEASPDKDPPVDVEASPDKDPPVDVEASPDKDTPVNVEASPDKDTPVDVEASPDKDTPVDVEA